MNMKNPFVKRLVMAVAAIPVLIVLVIAIVATISALLSTFGVYGCAMFIFGAAWSGAIWAMFGSEMFVIDSWKTDEPLTDSGVRVDPVENEERVSEAQNLHSPFAETLRSSTAIAFGLPESGYTGPVTSLLSHPIDVRPGWTMPKSGYLPPTAKDLQRGWASLRQEHALSE